VIPHYRQEWYHSECVLRQIPIRAFAIAVAGASILLEPASAQATIALPAEDRWLDADFEELFRIGSLMGEEWEQFGDVQKVMFDGAGRLHVFDDQAERIFVVDADGTGEEIVKDTIAEAWLPASADARSETELSAGAVSFGLDGSSGPPEFSPDLHWDVLPTGWWRSPTKTSWG